MSWLEVGEKNLPWRWPHGLQAEGLKAPYVGARLDYFGYGPEGLAVKLRDRESSRCERCEHRKITRESEAPWGSRGPVMKEVLR
jgi:hypothetical protein